jgi:hypothetical protein
LPALASDYFFDKCGHSIPSELRSGVLGVKDAFVSLLPYLPENKTWEELPDAVQNGVVKNDCVPVFDGVSGVASVLIGSAHDLSPLIPNRLAVVTMIEKMLLGFLLALK